MWGVFPTRNKNLPRKNTPLFFLGDKTPQTPRQGPIDRCHSVVLPPLRSACLPLHIFHPTPKYYCSFSAEIHDRGQNLLSFLAKIFLFRDQNPVYGAAVVVGVISGRVFPAKFDGSWGLKLKIWASHLWKFSCRRWSLTIDKSMFLAREKGRVYEVESIAPGDESYPLNSIWLSG